MTKEIKMEIYKILNNIIDLSIINPRYIASSKHDANDWGKFYTEILVQLEDLNAEVVENIREVIRYINDTNTPDNVKSRYMDILEDLKEVLKKTEDNKIKLYNDFLSTKAILTSTKENPDGYKTFSNTDAGTLIAKKHNLSNGRFSPKKMGSYMVLSEAKKIHKGIMCGHTESHSYTCIEGTTFYGDLCEDCLDKFSDILVFENENPGDNISDITIKQKYDDWDIFSRIVKK